MYPYNAEVCLRHLLDLRASVCLAGELGRVRLRHGSAPVLDHGDPHGLGDDGEEEEEEEDVVCVANSDSHGETVTVTLLLRDWTGLDSCMTLRMLQNTTRHPDIYLTYLVSDRAGKFISTVG